MCDETGGGPPIGEALGGLDAVARAAAFAQHVVIMDEPTAALGVQETAQVENIIRGLKDRGIPMILISHNLRQVFDLVDRIVVFRRGRIVASLRKDETDGNDIVSYITGVKGGSDATQLPMVIGDDIATILFTSGSDSLPKGVLLSHENLLANTAQIEARIRFSPAAGVARSVRVLGATGAIVFGCALPAALSAPPIPAPGARPVGARLVCGDDRAQPLHL